MGAAVYKIKEMRKPEDFIGYRKRTAHNAGAPSPRTIAGHRNRNKVDIHLVSSRKKRPHYRSSEVFMFALPIFTASHPATIVGVHVLNFCVRDGNRWTHMTINTNYLVTHTGFEPMLTA